jgi:hypothetical protein
MTKSCNRETSISGYPPYINLLHEAEASTAQHKSLNSTEASTAQCRSLSSTVQEPRQHSTEASVAQHRSFDSAVQEPRQHSTGALTAQHRSLEGGNALILTHSLCREAGFRWLLPVQRALSDVVFQFESEWRTELTFNRVFAVTN